MARRTAQNDTSTDGEVVAGSKSERTRARILAAAADVLSRKGYSGTRLVDVAEVAQLQAPAIYYYFGSREDLIEEVMWVGTADMRRHVIDVLAELSDDVDELGRILVVVEVHLRHVLELSSFTMAAIRNAGQIPDEIRQRQLAEQARYGRLWRGLIRDARASGAIREDLDPYVAEMLVLGAMNSAAEWWNPRRGSVEKVVENTQRFVRGALTGNDPAS